MTARYLVRLDDACPTMDRLRWDAVEAMLDEFGIRPLVAVVPDNRDPELVFAEADPQFWERVCRWEAKGWAIAMHGLHHVYHAADRRRLILPFYGRSEFAGLDLARQADLIRQSWAAFVANGIRPSVWVAPSHSFDRNTVRALASETPIRMISDGLAINCYLEDGFQWIPQQLWHPMPRKRGLWTICLHPNSLGDQEMSTLRTALAQPFYRARMAGIGDVAMATSSKTLPDRLYAFFFMARHHLVPVILPAYHAGRRILGRLRS